MDLNNLSNFVAWQTKQPHLTASIVSRMITPQSLWTFDNNCLKVNEYRHSKLSTLECIYIIAVMLQCWFLLSSSTLLIILPSLATRLVQIHWSWLSAFSSRMQWQPGAGTCQTVCIPWMVPQAYGPHQSNKWLTFQSKHAALYPGTFG